MSSSSSFTGFGSTPVAGSPVAVNISQGAPTSFVNPANDTAADIIRKHLSQAFGGTNWSALIQALGTGDEINRTNVKLAYDQLFLNRASGVYLDKRAADLNIIRNPLLGLSDNNFRKLAIKLNSNKITYESILEILEIYYGSDSVRATQQNLSAEPYALYDQDTLTLLIDEKKLLTVTFSVNDFTTIGSATANEVSNAINRAFINNRITSFATGYTDPISGNRYVKIYSPSLGIGGSVRIVGGKAQNTLNFPTPLNLTYTVSNTWTLSTYPTSSQPNYIRFVPTTNGGTSLLALTDYVNVYGTEFNSNNIGSFNIVNIGPNYFEINNPIGVAQSVTQLSANSITFFRPTKSSIQIGSNTVLVAQPSNNGTSISFPATSRVVNRSLQNASYWHSTNTFSITGSTLTAASNILTITTSAPHNLSAGNAVTIQDHFIGNGYYNVLSTPLPTSTSFSISLKKSYANQIAQFATSTTFSVGSIVYPISANGLAYICIKSTGATGTSEPAWPTSGTVTSGGATFAYYGKIGTILTNKPVTNDGYFGPYIYDTKSGIATTGVSCTLNQVIAKGTSYRQIIVSGADNFPDSNGYICFNFGYKNQTVPVLYLSRPDSSHILIDGNFVFPSDLPVGTTITLLVQKQPFLPNSQAQVGSFYGTGSSLGRVEAMKTINQAVASGIKVAKTVVYPGSRGLAGEIYPVSGSPKLNSAVYVWGSDAEQEILDLRNGVDPLGNV